LLLFYIRRKPHYIHIQNCNNVCKYKYINYLKLNFTIGAVFGVIYM